MLPNGQSTGQGQGVAMLSPVAIGRHCRWTRSPATASLQQLVSGYNCVLALAYLTCADKWLLLWWEYRMLLYSGAENEMLWGISMPSQMLLIRRCSIDRSCSARIQCFSSGTLIPPLGATSN